MQSTAARKEAIRKFKEQKPSPRPVHEVTPRLPVRLARDLPRELRGRLQIEYRSGRGGKSRRATQLRGRGPGDRDRGQRNA
jgi:hypothetical protein